MAIAEVADGESGLSVRTKINQIINGEVDEVDVLGIGITPVAGTRLTLPQEDDAVTPTLAFGDGNTGFYERIDNDLRVSVGGSPQFLWFGTQYRSNVGTGPAMINQSASNVVPTLIPDISDPNTGIGQAGEDQLSLIAGGVEGHRITESAGVITHDFTGDVGIGIAVPQNKLHIEDGQIRIKSASSSSNTGGGLVLERSANTGTTQMNIFTIENLDGTLKANAHYGVVSDRMQFSNNGGGNTTGPALAFGGTDWIAVSDARIKNNIADINYGLNTLMKLQPRKFKWNHNKKSDLGFIAQEVYPIIPEMVDKIKGDNGIKKIGKSGAAWCLNEKKIIPILVKAVQEQQKQIEELKSLIEKL